MRTPFGIALAGALMLGIAPDARAQYAFKDEPLMSINRSYLGYSNFVYYGPDPALGAYSGYNAAVRRTPAYVQAPTYVQNPAYIQAPARRGFRLFGRRGYPY